MQRADPLLTQSIASSECATNAPASGGSNGWGTEEASSNVKEEEMETEAQLSRIEDEKMKNTKRKPST